MLCFFDMNIDVDHIVPLLSIDKMKQGQGIPFYFLRQLSCGRRGCFDVVLQVIGSAQ